MQFDNISSLVIALLILLLVAGVFMAYHLKSLQSEIADLSYKFNFELISRADLLPLLIENMQKYFAKESFKNLIELRTQAIKTDLIRGQKAQNEELLWNELTEVMKNIDSKTEANKDIQLAVFKKDLADANIRVKEWAINYNNLVNRYNSLRSNVLVKPISLLMKAQLAKTY